MDRISGMVRQGSPSLERYSIANHSQIRWAALRGQALPLGNVGSSSLPWSSGYYRLSTPVAIAPNHSTLDGLNYLCGAHHTPWYLWDGIGGHSTRFPLFVAQSHFREVGSLMIGHECALSSAAFALSSCCWKWYYKIVYSADERTRSATTVIPSRIAVEERAICYFLLHYPPIFEKSRVTPLDAGFDSQKDSSNSRYCQHFPLSKYKHKARIPDFVYSLDTIDLLCVDQCCCSAKVSHRLSPSNHRTLLFDVWSRAVIHPLL